MKRIMVLMAAMLATVLLASGLAFSQEDEGSRASKGSGGRYVVVLDEAAEDRPGRAAESMGRRYGLDVGRVYGAALGGFAATVPPGQADELRSDGRVEYIERDGIVKATQQTLPWGVDRIDTDESSTQAGDGRGAVSGVNTYIIDTGIDTSHQDLNVVEHVDFASGPNRDCAGHGTHVAGTAAAQDDSTAVVGAAPGAPLTGVKVLGCNGSGRISDVIAGVEWVTANADKPAVANMSLGGGQSRALDEAVKASADSGVFYSVAAGNAGANACESSPARAGIKDGVLTTAATNRQDEEAAFSNFGPCVDLWAPGVDILSTRLRGGTTSLSGTSMAAPHVGGTGALYLSSNTGATPTAVERALVEDSEATGTNSKDGRNIRLVDAGNY